MRIEGPRGPSDVKKADKTKKSSGASGVFSSFLSDETDAPAGPSSSGGVANVSGLLAVQSSEDPTERKARKRMVDRAGKVLDILGNVHRGLVNGTISIADMKAISANLAERREKVSDPQLAEILNEVELRAAVELAKLELAAEKKR